MDQYELKSSAKTANYSVWPRDNETVFTNAGAAAAITFTLPPIAQLQDGWEIEIFGVADYPITIATIGSDTIVGLDSASNTTLVTTTLVANIGSHMRVRYDATAAKFLCVVSGSILQVSVAKTADYPVVAGDCGKVFTNGGAGAAVNFTLPAIANVYDGWFIDVFVVADNSVTVTAPAGKLVAYNNAAATSVAYATLSEVIGGGFRIRYDGNAAKYLAFMMRAEAQTVTVA